MPNLPQQETIVQYQVNGSQTAFSFAFYAPLPTDIEVYSQPSNAIPNPDADILVYGVDYTVTYNADPFTGGTINTTVPPPTGNYFTINRQVAASLNINFASAQNFSGANLDAALDRLLLLCQQNLNYNLQRNLSYVINTYLPNASPYTQLPQLANGQIWYGTGTGVVAVTLTQGADTSVLRSQLALANSTSDGASIVGYWDKTSLVATTVDAQLNKLTVQGLTYVDTGAANAIVVTAADYGVPVAGSVLKVKVIATNLGTAPTTLKLNTEDAKNVFINNMASIPASALIINGYYDFVYTGSAWQLINPSNYCYGVSVTRTAPGSVGAGAPFLYPFDSITDDPNNMFNTVTSSMNPKIAGWYEVQTNVQISSAVDQCNCALFIFKNGTLVREIVQGTTSGGGLVDGLAGAGRVQVNGNTDTIQVYIQNSGAEVVTLGQTAFADIYYLGNS